MQKKSNSIFAFPALLIVTLACANPLGGNAPEFAALTAPAPEASATPQPLTSSLLPHSMYFLNNDGASLSS